MTSTPAHAMAQRFGVEEADVAKSISPNRMRRKREHDPRFI
jgi:hypothetical protein